jgi:uncharacterized protein YegL
MNDKLTAITVILDKSGSMNSIRNDVIGGFNSFIEDQKKFDGEATVTLTLFDSEYNIKYINKDIKNVDLLNTKNYVPSGNTALNDAVGRTIDELGNRLDNLKEDEKPGKVIVVIITDGEENSSREYQLKKVKEKIEHQQKIYNWEFIYIGAEGLNTQSIQQNYGIQAQNVAAFVASGIGTRSMYDSVSCSVTNLRSGKAANLKIKN